MSSDVITLLSLPSRHGRGTFSGADGRVYCGEFSDGKKHGRGAHMYSLLSSYDGEYIDGIRNGG